METKDKKFEEMSNNELVQVIKNLATNNDAIQKETVQLIAILEEVQKQWLDASLILSQRMGVNVEELKEKINSGEIKE